MIHKCILKRNTMQKISLDKVTFVKWVKTYVDCRYWKWSLTSDTKVLLFMVPHECERNPFRVRNDFSALFLKLNYVTKYTFIACRIIEKQYKTEIYIFFLIFTSLQVLKIYLLINMFWIQSMSRIYLNKKI